MSVEPQHRKRMRHYIGSSDKIVGCLLHSHDNWKYFVGEIIRAAYSMRAGTGLQALVSRLMVMYD